MSASGAGVLQLRSVEYARNHGVRIHCRSSFDDGPGTVVVSEEETMEHPLVTAVTHSTAETRITLLGVPDEPGIAGRIFRALADANVNVDMIIQNEPLADGPPRRHVVHRAARGRAHRARRRSKRSSASWASSASPTEESMGKVSIVGAGMRSHPGVAATVFTVLGDAGINIEMISTSPIKISCVIAGDRVPEAVRGLHAAFGLSGDGHDRGRRPVRGRRDERRAAGRRGRRDGGGRADHARGARRAPLPRRARSCPFASERSAGREMPGIGTVLPLARGDDRAASTSRSSRPAAAPRASGRRASPRPARSSSTTRARGGWTRSVPLVVSEVNPDALARIERGIVANPNCTTMVIMLPLKALHDAFGLREIVATSFQAAGGAGQKGMDELAAQVPLVHAAREQLVGDGAAAIAAIEHSVHAAPLAYNVVPWLGSSAGDGYSDEEMKLVNESRKILELPDLRVSPTCVRVPVMVGHSIELRATFARAPETSRGPAPRSRPSRGSCSIRCRPRCTTPAATRSRSGACAPTSATATRSTCSSSATTCSRARRSTPCRSPSCSSSAACSGGARGGARLTPVVWVGACADPRGAQRRPKASSRQRRRRSRSRSSRSPTSA